MPPEQHTLYWKTRTPAAGYHIDYVFVPALWLDGVRCEIGAYDDWIATTPNRRSLSDHAPVTVDVVSQRADRSPSFHERLNIADRMQTEGLRGRAQHPWREGLAVGWEDDRAAPLGPELEVRPLGSPDDAVAVGLKR